MIRSDAEYQRAKVSLEEQFARLEDYRKQMDAEGLPADQIKQLMDPLICHHLEIKEDIEEYDRYKRCDRGECRNLHGLGRMLIAIRIALGLSQQEFAKRIGVHPSQVCRDERNEYHGITIERAAAILDTFEVELSSSFIRPPFTKAKKGKSKAA